MEPPPSQPLRLPPPRPGWVFIVVALAMVAASWGACGFALWRSRTDALNDWRLFLSDLSNVAAQHADQAVAAADAVLGRVVAEVNTGKPADQAQLRMLLAGEDVFNFIRERQRDLSQIDVVTLVDARGDVLNFSRSHPPPAINLADRDYFQAHAKDPTLEVYLSEPVRNRGNGQWTFYLARKLTDPQGRMIGLALVGIQSEYFQRFYSSVNFGDGNLTLSLLRRDGTLLARFPTADGFIGRRLADSASLRLLAQAPDASSAAVVTREPRATDPNDRRLRVVAPRASHEYPLVVVAQANESLVLKDWRRSAFLMGAVTAAMDVMLCLVVLWVYVLTRRRYQVLLQLEKALQDAQQASRAKTAFLANMSHEIRTPMNGVIGMTQLLLLSGLAPQQQGYASAAHRSAEALMRLLQRILQVASLESGELVSQHEAFEPRVLVAQQVAVVQAAAQAKGLRLWTQVDDAVPPSLVGDARHLGEVLGHLLDNAVRFTEEGEVGVLVRHQGCEQGLHRLEFAVHDTGAGIAPEELARLFEPFSQGDESITRRHGGSGLGLTLARELVRVMGGRLSADSRVGQGSVFRVVLRLRPL